MINYEGYKQILGNVKQMIQAEPLTEMEKDSLLSKINNFEDELDEMLSGRVAELEMYVEHLENRVANSENTSIRLR
jgi:polyhydroxyalkanoate synthesis regulator phasin|tara:strand:+ start:1711 stop:1938 length:228 start_codon:yes stop_codon:yes gene_type:complete